MSGIGFSEFLILCLIGLIVLGPKRLPQVANQIGSWVGQARRMTRVMKRQLEEELDFDTDLNVRPTIHQRPLDDDTYSPVHGQPSTTVGAATDETDPSVTTDAGEDNTKHEDDHSGDEATSSDDAVTEGHGEQRSA